MWISSVGESIVTALCTWYALWTLTHFQCLITHLGLDNYKTCLRFLAYSWLLIHQARNKQLEHLSRLICKISRLSLLRFSEIFLMLRGTMWAYLELKTDPDSCHPFWGNRLLLRVMFIKFRWRLSDVNFPKLQNSSLRQYPSLAGNNIQVWHVR